MLIRNNDAVQAECFDLRHPALAIECQQADIGHQSGGAAADNRSGRRKPVESAQRFEPTGFFFHVRAALRADRRREGDPLGTRLHAKSDDRDHSDTNRYGVRPSHVHLV
jgi:hypothetical protein